MQTAKSLGYKKGDFVYTGAFPAIIISDAHTATPCCEVWGIEHEMGSVYARDLRMLTYQEFVDMANQYGFDGTAYAKESKVAILNASKHAKGE